MPVLHRRISTTDTVGAMRQVYCDKPTWERCLAFNGYLLPYLLRPRYQVCGTHMGFRVPY
eukprot:1612959-Rhodomonas_salina.1